MVVFTGELVGITLMTPVFSDGTCDSGLDIFELTGAVVLETHCNSTEGLTPVPIPPSLGTPVPGVDVHTGPWHVWTKICIPTPLLA